MEPKIIKERSTGPLLQKCTRCNIDKAQEQYLQVRYWAFPNKRYHICNTCLKEYFIEQQWSWESINKFLQTIDIPFVPSEFERLHDINGDDVLPIYVKMFNRLEYQTLDWKMYNDKYIEIKEKGQLDLELPNVRDSYFDDLRLRWGQGYDEEALLYLERLYNGMLKTQNINGALQIDQAQKLCKVSWEIDERIRASTDFDKLMASYDKLAKIADLTSKNIKSDSDFSSMSEIIVWLEKRGWLNMHYDGAKRDIIDELVRSSQSFAQRLYTNETNVAEEINDRIQQLKIASELGKEDEQLEQRRLLEDPFFKLEMEEDLESYDNEAYRELIIDNVLDADTTEV